MDTSENIAKLTDTTYKNIIEEFGPCTKQLVVAGRAYLKSLQAMVNASHQYTDALARVAVLAGHSTIGGSSDIGSSIYEIVSVNKELLAQQSNMIKSLEFDFLEPMEIAADKDTKLVGREQKRFQQLYKGRRDAYLKCFSTLKKTRRKKNIKTEKQLGQMKLLESAKERLEVLCDDSLKEAITQERVMYGTVLERQCALNRQFLIYHKRGSKLLEEKLPQWEELSQTRDKLPASCFTAVRNGTETLPRNMESIYSIDSTLDAVIRNNSIARSYGSRNRDSCASHTVRSESNIYARPLMRAKSEYCLSTSSSETLQGDVAGSRYSRIVEYNDDKDEFLYVRSLYAYRPTGDHQLVLQEGDIIRYIIEENTTGWQFGDNLTSGKSGWFPVSYTEALKEIFLPNGDSPESSHSAPNPASAASVRPKQPVYQDQESNEYATLTRITPKKLLPVEPPTVATAFGVKSDGYQQYASQPNILEAIKKDDIIYRNGRQLPSMRL